MHLNATGRPSMLLLASLLALLLAPGRGAAQDPGEGFPVTDPDVVRSCGSCHTVDADGMMGRISFLRKTPEGWQTSIRRMVSLHDVRITPEVARRGVRYLADNHGIAPEELEPARFEVERRIIDWRYDGDEDARETCGVCHSLGRVITQRRIGEEWMLLTETHRTLYPLVDRQAYRNSGPPPAGSDQPRTHPVDRAVEHLARAFPLRTASWAAWSANVRPTRLEGRWLVRGHDPARGPVTGEVVIRAVPGEVDSYTTSTRLVFPEDGGTLERTGQSVVYTGHQWRGRSGAGTGSEYREVLSVDRGWETMDGRWFTGSHDELGVDVTLHRVGSAPVLAGIHPRALPTGSTGLTVQIHGANLPAGTVAGELDLGPGVTVRELIRESEGVIRARVDVAPSAPVGERDVRLGNASLPRGGVVYDQMHSIRIRPRAGMARVGGVVMPARFQQFEAVAFHNGVDGDPGTEDDLELGRVEAEWSIEEYPVTYDDDDRGFVGSIDQRGFFTPAPDGPNPDRSAERSNVGDVWVVAAFTLPGSDTPLRTRAQLLVSVPVYIEWDAWPDRPLTPEPARTPVTPRTPSGDLR